LIIKVKRLTMSEPSKRILSKGTELRASLAAAEEKKDIFATWFAKLYDISQLSIEDLRLMYEALAYKGFDRTEILNQMAFAFPDQRLAMEAILAVALRGPQAGSRIKLSNKRTLAEMGIPGSGGKGTKNLTCNKIQAATADLAAYMMKKLNVAKRLDLPCPGWLQFPSAGSIKLPGDLRAQHKEFAKKFSEVIGGNFQEQIYVQMVNNSYLDVNLHLFD
jgi:hypothetical protein